MKKQSKTEEEEKFLYHNTHILLKNYRDVIWNLELSVQQIKNNFEIEHGNTIEEFLESTYLVGMEISGGRMEHYTSCVERSYKMIKLLEDAIDLLRRKHKFGESYYWILFYTYLSPQQLYNTDEIIETLRPHIRTISPRTYFRRKKEAVEALDSVLWGYTTKSVLPVLEPFFPNK